ncbi:MAG: phospholipase [Leptospiraceae bacterium]|nr:phospholipase [Leptospiraceae bacterium]MCP5495607.1 phospholipase [Leptospiraceae bacterium]
MKLIKFLILLTLLPTYIYSWANHTLNAYPTFENFEEVSKAPKVKVESLETFLEKEKEGIAKLLEDQELYLKTNVSNYPSKPKNLKFDPSSSDLRLSFLKALRLNPNIKLGYYIQELPGTDMKGKKLFSKTEVTFFKEDKFLDRYALTALDLGQKETALRVLATACDEPDYGSDVGLYQDNNTDFGKEYGFGIQPFGNPEYEFSSQAPFHIGFYHESTIIYTFGSFLKQTLPEYRIYQNLSLSRFAFETGHPYWGWRFLGWGLHYIQDITQPYHARVLPGYSTLKMFIINLLAIIGLDGFKNDAITRVSDRHISVENYEYATMEKIYLQEINEHPLIMALKDTSSDSSYGLFNFYYSRNIVARESWEFSDEFDRLIENWKGVLKLKDVNFPLENLKRGKESEELDHSLIRLMKSFGAHSRNFVRSALR